MSDACHHQLRWLYLTADPVTRVMGFHLACACGQARLNYPGRNPAMDSGTARRPLGIREARTSAAEGWAAQQGCHLAGGWDVQDEHSKRAPVIHADATPAGAADHDRRTRPGARP